MIENIQLSIYTPQFRLPASMVRDMLSVRHRIHEPLAVWSGGVHAAWFRCARNVKPELSATQKVVAGAAKNHGAETIANSGAGRGRGVRLRSKTVRIRPDHSPQFPLWAKSNGAGPTKSDGPPRSLPTPPVQLSWLDHFRSGLMEKSIMPSLSWRLGVQPNG